MVLLADYSLSPEVRFPVVSKKYYFVVAYVFRYVFSHERARNLNTNSTYIAIDCDSAGANTIIGITCKLPKI